MYWLKCANEGAGRQDWRPQKSKSLSASCEYEQLETAKDLVRTCIFTGFINVRDIWCAYV